MPHAENVKGFMSCPGTFYMIILVVRKHHPMFGT